MSMNAHFSVHPLYRDEPALLAATRQLLDRGYTVFQIFEFPPDERWHSVQLLSLADPDFKVRRILSLGCGVGGMEAYWLEARPQLRFELVNISQSQLELCQCPGNKILANAENYSSDQVPFDMVLIAYLLGHVDVKDTLNSALAALATDGLLVIYDVFNGTERFCEELFYQTPKLRVIRQFGMDNDLRCRLERHGDIPLAPFFREHYPWIAHEVTPALFVFEK